jgi:hypothetical protein
MSRAPHRYAAPISAPAQTDSRDATPKILADTARWISLESAHMHADVLPAWDRWITTAWLASSILTFGWVAATMALMARRRRSWIPGILFGREILWSEDFGPAGYRPANDAAYRPVRGEVMASLVCGNYYFFAATFEVDMSLKSFQ